MSTNGIYRVNDILDDVWTVYDRGLNHGLRVSWDNVADLYRVRPGEMTVVTGIPGHGKSEVLDGIIMDLAVNHDWRFCLFSPENYPVSRHYVKLLEKYTGKRFDKGKKNIQYLRDRLTLQEIEETREWMNDHFVWIYPEADEVTLDEILMMLSEVRKDCHINGFILDPWNELDHQRPTNLSETEYISKSLTKVRRYARRSKIHTWLVAHPTKLQKVVKDKEDQGKYPVPTPYDISGSAHWRNKADHCLTIHRENPNENIVQIHVQKIKFKEVGKLGMAQLHYEWETGRFSEYRDYCAKGK